MKVECHTPDLPGCPRPSAHVAPLPSFQHRGWGLFAPVPLQGTLACPRTCSRVLGTMNRVRLCGLHLQGAGSLHHHQRSGALLGEAVKRHGKFDPLPSVNAEGFHAAGCNITLGGPGLVSPIENLGGLRGVGRVPTLVPNWVLSSKLKVEGSAYSPEHSLCIPLLFQLCSCHCPWAPWYLAPPP